LHPVLLQSPSTLLRFLDKVENCELNKKRFPGAVYRIKDPKIASLIFSSGKIVLTGIRNTKALTDSLAIIIKSLKKAGVVTLREPKVAVTNMVCSAIPENTSISTR
jgi:transcription initiation factor TFIID TATA-box-binding protein